jgi:hypothetical protein
MEDLPNHIRTIGNVKTVATNETENNVTTLFEILPISTLNTEFKKIETASVTYLENSIILIKATKDSMKPTSTEKNGFKSNIAIPVTEVMFR